MSARGKAGEGINDRPAWRKAHVGIAMGTQSDVEMDSAVVTLVHGDCGIVRPDASVARRWQYQTNLFCSCYNAWKYRSQLCLYPCSAAADPNRRAAMSVTRSRHGNALASGSYALATRKQSHKEHK